MATDITANLPEMNHGESSVYESGMDYSIADSTLDFLCDKPELAADTIAFLARERRQWLAGR